MKLRIAKKIIKAVGTLDEARYTSYQIGRADARVEKTKSAKQANEFWFDMMRTLGPNGRAQIIKRWSAGQAFALLMREG